jgi:hypothetical protein
MDQNVKQHRFLKYLFMAFTHTKKVDTESFIQARIRIRIRSQTSGSGSDQKGPDPPGSGSATLAVAHVLRSGWALRTDVNQCCGSGSARIRNSRVPDPGPYLKMDVNINKNHQKRSNFIILTILICTRILNLSIVKNCVLKCHFRTFEIIFLQEKGRIRIQVFSEFRIQVFSEFRIRILLLKSSGSDLFLEEM